MVPSTVDEAKAKLEAWKASLKNQQARLFQLEETKRHQTRIDMQVSVKQLNDSVEYWSTHIWICPFGVLIKEYMDRINLLTSVGAIRDSWGY